MTLYINGTTGISGVDGSAATPALQGNDTNTGISFGSDVFIGSTGGSERWRTDASGRFLVGTSTTEGFGAKLQIRDDGGLNCELFRSNATASGPTFALNKSRGSAGSPTAVGSGDILAYLAGKGYDGSNYIEAATIKVEVDGAVNTANDMPGRIVFSTTADGASSPTERMRIASSGLVSTEGNLQCKGRLYWSSGADSSSLSTSSIGAATTTVYIGNAAIQVSSDVRLKENIVNTVVDATKELKKVRVVDFTWNDPTDSSFNNRNARGVWTGLIAQELVEVFPFAVNAPRKEKDLSIDYGDEAIWTVDQNQLVPVLIKAFQQQQERIETLEAKVAAFEAS